MAFDAAALKQAFLDTDENLAPVKFGTSGHRGKLGREFSQRHVLAVAQAVADLRRERGYDKAILIGGDTRLLSLETARLCAQVLTANGATVVLPDQAVPTPVFSLAILHDPEISDGIIGTASHNPPEDMGIKYNPEQGGPAGPETTGAIQNMANECLAGNRPIHCQSLDQARAQGRLIEDKDLIGPYIERLARNVDLAAIRDRKLKIRIHPLGGAALRYFEALIAWGLDSMEIVDCTLDPSFGFVPVDYDGKVRMDPSSTYPLRPLLDLVSADRFEMAGATDPDADRFGVATGKAGLLNPNHALCVVADYLMKHRPEWPGDLAIGRTIGTTHLLDRIARANGRQVDEMDVGFKHFVHGLLNDRYLVAGEESAGMSFFRWTTEKDGIAAVMLFAEIMAVTGKDLKQLYDELAEQYGRPAYARNDQPANDQLRASLRQLTKDQVTERLAATGNRIGDRKVVDLRDSDGIKLYLEDDCGWALVRPSGTEPIVKFYTESFIGEEHRKSIERDAMRLFGIA